MSLSIKPLGVTALMCLGKRLVIWLNEVSMRWCTGFPKNSFHSGGKMPPLDQFRREVESGAHAKSLRSAGSATVALRPVLKYASINSRLKRLRPTD